MGRMKTKEFIGTCVENPFERIERLVEITENAHEISKATFFKNCFVHPEFQQQMRQFPNDYVFSAYRGIYFFTWSAIEHFYQ